MIRRRPTVSIGLPVYNGQRYLAETINAILTQSLSNFELIISDNCSSDATEEICRQFVKHDSRIRYFRQTKNRGAAWNYNHVFELARAPYFKWTAHDDLIEPKYLAVCVRLLEDTPAVVAAFTAVKRIDEDGNVISIKPPAQSTQGATASQRFRSTLVGVPFEAVFGVIRRDVLCRTALIGSYANSDEVLLRELTLYGSLVQLPDPLFHSRDHAGNSVRSHPSPAQRAAWFNPQSAQHAVFPICRESIEYARSIRRSSLPLFERMACYVHLSRWLRWNAGRIWYDIRRGFRQMRQHRKMTAIAGAC
jgi:glycosyltransferase involved in cell wall biosynthesis